MAERKLGRSVSGTEVPLPACAMHLWEWYLQLQSIGQSLPYSEIVAWQQLTGTIIYPEEIEILQDMFFARREWHLKKSSRKHD